MPLQNPPHPTVRLVGDMRHHVLTALLVCAASFVCAQPAFAEGAIEAFAFDNPAQEARYQALTAELRCPKCLNTNLAGSDAPIAADLRATIHRLILEGATDQAIRDYLVARYGEFVLYDPPVRRGTLLLWLAPLVLLGVGFTMIAVMALRRRGATQPLNDVEQARLADLLRDTRNAADEPK
jgi:cytochrome c-type biogenesis protein CcmH